MRVKMNLGEYIDDNSLSDVNQHLEDAIYNKISQLHSVKILHGSLSADYIMFELTDDGEYIVYFTNFGNHSKAAESLVDNDLKWFHTFWAVDSWTNNEQFYSIDDLFEYEKHMWRNSLQRSRVNKS